MNGFSYTMFAARHQDGRLETLATGAAAAAPAMEVPPSLATLPIERCEAKEKAPTVGDTTSAALPLTPSALRNRGLNALAAATRAPLTTPAPSDDNSPLRKAQSTHAWAAASGVGSRRRRVWAVEAPREEGWGALGWYADCGRCTCRRRSSRPGCALLSRAADRDAAPA